MNVKAIEQKIRNAKQLDFGTVFNQCIELFKKVWLQGFVSMLLTGVLMLPLIFIAYIPMIGLAIFNPDTFNETEPNAVIIILMVILACIVIVGFIAIAMVLRASFYRIMKIKDLQLNESENYFYFFKKPYLIKAVKLGLFMFGIVIIATILFVFPIIYVIIPLYLMIVFFAFNPELEALDIVKLSFKLGTKKWLFVFGLLTTAYFLSAIVGFFMCFVGIYVTQQFIAMPAYFIYKEVIGFKNESIHDRISKLN